MNKLLQQQKMEYVINKNVTTFTLYHNMVGKLMVNTRTNNQNSVTKMTVIINVNELIRREKCSNYLRGTVRVDL